MILTLWDSFVDRECKLFSENIDKKPVIFATNLKVTSFLGLKLSTKFRSTFMNSLFVAVQKWVEWKDTSLDKVDEFILKKPYTKKSATKLSPPMHNKFILIQILQDRLLPRKFYWVNATAKMEKIYQKCWYMTCSSCYQRSSVDFGEIYVCIFCKSSNSKAITRARAYVQLSDVTRCINASAISEAAEKFMFTDAQILMEETNFGSQADFVDIIGKMQNIERTFYLKATQAKPNSSNYKF
ncbi:replication protein A 70 kDa DNA-binding subunit B-like [Olea europaea var. sylvestris]|uniref:replication protein A 70 kDa DNA-binding subunit B-like n=1 Tax=Olea europaea var. sylvestris TaxID=158386 RepID=UPI000C1D3DDD|nr:replication protein A 70 kDa DNA-binding subunit B-like [Olea europaea var. sylvestris]